MLRMKKFTEKFYEKLIELSIVQVTIAFVIITGFSLMSFLQLTKRILGNPFTFNLGQFIAFIAVEILLVLFIIYLRKKLISKQRFNEGTKVTLSTQTQPIMSAGKFNFMNNKVQCTWTHERAIKQEWINQNQLLEYKLPGYASSYNKNTGFWDRGRDGY